jgi:hypothetical protein
VKAGMRHVDGPDGSGSYIPWGKALTCRPRGRSLCAFVMSLEPGTRSVGLPIVAVRLSLRLSLRALLLGLICLGGSVT